MYLLSLITLFYSPYSKKVNPNPTYSVSILYSPGSPIPSLSLPNTHSIHQSHVCAQGVGAAENSRTEWVSVRRVHCCLQQKLLMLFPICPH